MQKLRFFKVLLFEEIFSGFDIFFFVISAPNYICLNIFIFFGNSFFIFMYFSINFGLKNIKFSKLSKKYKNIQTYVIWSADHEKKYVESRKNFSEEQDFKKP